PVSRSPYWASLYRDTIAPPNEPLQQSFIPPLRRVAGEAFALVGTATTALAQPAPVDHYAIVAGSPALGIFRPFTNASDATSGDYLVDYSTGKVTFSNALSGPT